VRNATASPLLKLPAEIRNQIYEHVMDGVFPIRPRHFCSVKTTDFDFLRICSQIYQEARLLFFNSNTFTFGWEKDLERLTADQKTAIRRVDLHFCVKRWGSLFGNWTSLCKAVAKQLTGLRSLKLFIHVIWFDDEFHKRLLDGRNEWMKGVNALRDMNSVKVEGELSTRVYEAGVNKALFVIDFHDLDSLVEAFTETQEKKVRELYGR